MNAIDINNSVAFYSGCFYKDKGCGFEYCREIILGHYFIGIVCHKMMWGWCDSDVELQSTSLHTLEKGRNIDPSPGMG